GHVRTARCGRPDLDLVLRSRSRIRAQWTGTAAFNFVVSQRGFEFGARYAERAVAAVDGHIVHGVGVLASRARIQRDPNRRRLHRDDAWVARVVARRWATGE